MKSAKKIDVPVVAFVFLSCVICWPKLYDNSHIIRFVALSVCLSLFFIYIMIKGNKLLIPGKFVNGLYVSLILLFFLSIAWSVNFGEAVFAASMRVLAVIATLVSFNYISSEKGRSVWTLWFCCLLIATVYMLVALAQLVKVGDFSYAQLYNVSGINGHKNLFSSITLLLAGFMLAASFMIDRKHVRTVSIIYFVVAVALVFVLKSRAAMIGLVVAVAVFLLVSLAYKKKINCPPKVQNVMFLLLVLVVYLFFTFALRVATKYSIPTSSEMSRVEHDYLRTSSLSERFLLWEKSYHLIDKHPVTGCGIGNWKIVFPDAGLRGLYRADIKNVTFLHPHNEFVEVLAEGGYPTFLLFVTLICYVAVRSFFAIVKLKDDKEFVFASVVLSIFVGYYANSIFDFPSFRVEHMVWKGVVVAFLLYYISQDDGQHSLRLGVNSSLLCLTAAMAILGLVRLNGERNTYYMQACLKSNDWRGVEKYGGKAVSSCYSIDPLGIPIDWYVGKAQGMMGNPVSLKSFRKAFDEAPFCKENLNDLGLGEYFIKNNVEKAFFYLKEAVRISPNFLNPYFNLAMICIKENRISEAKEIMEAIDMNEYKKEVLAKDPIFFEHSNVEDTKHKIDVEYEKVLMIRHIIDSLTISDDGRY